VIGRWQDIPGNAAILAVDEKELLHIASIKRKYEQELQMALTENAIRGDIRRNEEWLGQLQPIRAFRVRCANVLKARHTEIVSCGSVLEKLDHERCSSAEIFIRRWKKSCNQLPVKVVEHSLRLNDLEQIHGLIDKAFHAAERGKTNFDSIPGIAEPVQ
jgi:hypothetical protein